MCSDLVELELFLGILRQMCACGFCRVIYQVLVVTRRNYQTKKFCSIVRCHNLTVT